MYRTTIRSASRSTALRSLRTQQPSASFRRFASTSSPADKPRSWKSSALRWGLAGGILYYYTNSAGFSDDAASQTVKPPPAFADSDLPTVDSILEEKRKQIKPPQPEAAVAAKTKEQKPEQSPAKDEAPQAAPTPEGQTPEDGSAGAVGGVQALEGEADQQGAFNPETGEINWDCPCLGGMAHGPCGEEFKTAFSCFVYSEADPKGMDCIEKFQGMQDCFRQYPDIYGGELTDDDEAGPPAGDAPAAEAPTAVASDAAPAPETKAPEAAAPSESKAAAPEKPKATPAPAVTSSNIPAAASAAPVEEPAKVRMDPTSVGGDASGKLPSTEDLPGVTPIREGEPRTWVDATAANEGKGPAKASA